MLNLRRDLTYSIRMLWRGRAAAFAIIGSIGMGIGATVMVFAWLDNLVLNPFPAIPSGRTLVALNAADADGRVQGMPPIAYRTFDEWRTRSTSFLDIAAHAPIRLNMRAASTAVGEPIWAELVSANFLTLLQLAPYRGRFFETGDADRRMPVAVVSHAYWERRFGRDETLVGRTLLFNGHPITVIGIAPPRFSGVVAGLAFDVWLPIWLQPSLVGGPDWLRDRAARRLQVVARLGSGVDIVRARAELAAVARTVSQSNGDRPPTSAAVRYVRDTQLGSLMGPLATAMMAIAALVLVTACANVTSLLLARALERQRETAVRIAIGAGRGPLVRQHLVESGMLGVLGGCLGLAVAATGKNTLNLFVPRVPLPVHLSIALNSRVVAAAVATTLVTAALVGVAPALRAARADVNAALRGTTGSHRRRARTRQALVTLQVACSLVALSTGALLLRGVRAAELTPLGFGDPEHVLLVATDFSFAGLSRAQTARLASELLDQVRQLPGVAGAAFASMVPLGFGGHASVPTHVGGYTPTPDEAMAIERVVVSDGYFETMEIPILNGRAITSADRADTLRIAIVNETFANRYWTGVDPIGRRVDQGDGWAVIVGVAKNSATQDIGVAPPPLVYHAADQAAAPSVTLHVRTKQDPKTFVEPLRLLFAAAHPDLPVLDARTLAEHIAASTFVPLVGSAFIGTFGIVALLIASLGLYGALAHDVAERRRDTAIAIAIGASPRRIAAAVFARGLHITAIGSAIGLALSWGVTTVIRAKLVGLPASDASTIAGCVGVVLAVAAIVCALPAARAARVDAIGALKGMS